MKTILQFFKSFFRRIPSKPLPQVLNRNRKNLKKVIFWLFMLGFFCFLAGMSFFLYFFFSWQSDKSLILKQAEIYYNQILKETQTITHYKTIGGKDYSLLNVEEPIRVFDYRGELLGEFSNERRSFIGPDEISPYFLYALLSTEDTQFYFHSGINYKSILRATLKNIAALKAVEGGSTLTQQLSKLLFTDRAKTLKRKIYEFFCSRELEKIYTKEDILLMYSNLIFLGHGAYGLEYASQLYFKKPAKNLDLAEASFLVAMISNPTRYSPFLRRENAKIKHQAVLNRMVETGYITTITAKKVFEEFWKKNLFDKKNLSEAKQVIRTNDAPYIMEEVRRFLVDQYGEGFFVKYKGSQIYTTIDKRLQVYGSEVLSRQLKYLRSIASPKIPKAEREGIQASVLFTVPDSGEIRVLIGGDGFTSKNQLNRAFQAKRQVGSTMKPFLYLAGLEKKVITPFTVFEDIPLTLEMENAPKDQKFWKVSNFRDKYKGYLTASEALYFSSNVVAARLVYLIGVEGLQRVLKDALRLEASEAEKRFPSYQYSLALGAAEMTPLEVNSLYAMLANQGVAVQPYLIDKVIDSKSSVIYEKSMPQKRRISEKEPAYLLLNIMRKVLEAGGTAGYIRKTYGLEGDFAGKTGTTQGNRDIWFNGINADLAGTVWIGHDANHSLGSNFTGGMGAAPIWALIMKKASSLYDLGVFRTDDSYNLVRQPVCLLSGKVPEEGKCRFIEENAYFLEGTEPGEYCDLPVEEEKKRALMKGWIYNEETGQKEEPKTEETVEFID